MRFPQTKDVLSMMVKYCEPIYFLLAFFFDFVRKMNLPKINCLEKCPLKGSSTICKNESSQKFAWRQSSEIL